MDAGKAQQPSRQFDRLSNRRGPIAGGVALNGIELVRWCKRVREAVDQRHRYAHILRVARLASRLARIHGRDPERARIAGLLHDLARLYPAERLLAECSARGMPIDPFERANPVVLHARLGAELARERFGIEDEEILQAIRAHTLGAGAMSPLDTILFLADGLEPGRDFPERAELAGLACVDLGAAARALLQATIAYHGARGLHVAPATLAAVEFFAERRKHTA